MTRLNYSSAGSDPELDAWFERELESARGEPGDPLAHVIDGRALRSGTVAERFDPSFNSRVVSRAHECDRATLAAALEAARRAAGSWRSRTVAERVGALAEAKSRFSEEVVRIGAVIAAETGKTRLEAMAEAEEAVDLIDTYSRQITEQGGFATELGCLTSSEHNLDVLRPYGVFAVLSPFNFPVALTVNMTVAALLTGNTVILKPSDKTPRSGALAAEILSTALPAGVLNLVHGGAATGRALTEAGVDGVAFTGSARVGWEIVRRLHSAPFGRPVLAEMGGKNPAVVAASADISSAAEGIVRSAFGLSGQKCSACSRVVVVGSVHDELLDALRERSSALVLSDSSDRRSHLGPVIDAGALERFRTAVTESRRDGWVVTGGGQADLPGWFVEPTIVDGLPRGHRLTREELFIPFVTVTAADSFDDALEEANAVDYGLSAGVYSRDQGELDAFLERIEAGVVYVNRPTGATTGAWPGIQSFCGWKASGSAGKGGLGPWYLPGFMREQNRTFYGAL